MSVSYNYASASLLQEDDQSKNNRNRLPHMLTVAIISTLLTSSSYKVVIFTQSYAISNVKMVYSTRSAYNHFGAASIVLCTLKDEYYAMNVLLRNEYSDGSEDSFIAQRTVFSSISTRLTTNYMATRQR